MKRLIIPSIIILYSLVVNAQTTDHSSKDTSVKVRLVCTTGLSKTATPLYVVDGKIADSVYVTSLDPKSIASVSILKGNKAIKKYGRKGENGVIIVTTKKDLLLQ